MELLGGIYRDGRLQREFSFRLVTGAVEMAVGESRAESWPDRVTDALWAALDQLGGESPNRAQVHDMCVGDRQYMTRQLAAHLGRDRIWLTRTCTGCGESYDFDIEQSRLPYKPAGSGYPFAEVEVSQGRCRLRMPTGADQVALAGLPPLADPRRALARRLVVESDPEDWDVDALGADDLAAIETAVEEVAPEVSTRARLSCPHCGQAGIGEIDPYVCLTGGLGDLYGEIHALASHYHWSEAEILGLPVDRRHTYLHLIDRARGMSQ